MRMKEHRGTGVRWLSGAILVLAGCASSPQVMMQSLPNAGETRPSGGSLTGEVSLREAGVLGREDRFFLTQVSVKNRTGAPLAFGPQHVYLADAGGTLIPRVSEQWLPGYYDASIRGRPVAPDRDAVPDFPTAKVTLGGVAYAAPPLTNTQRDEVAKEMAKLVEATFVAPQKAARGTVFDKGSEVALGVLLQEVTLGPGDGVSGYVYFYQPASTRPPYPLRLVIDLEGEVHAFQFRER
ncbi:MAG: hypothetical protein XU15_C0003G0136 [candidate division NC10 bacterium CSP1-5]|nr:MAG: hypothetical protein XU15_C0003G0136 [candidate division NC10 bacterium CSP1-5]